MTLLVVLIIFVQTFIFTNDVQRGLWRHEHYNHKSCWAGNKFILLATTAFCILLGDFPYWAEGGILDTSWHHITREKLRSVFLAVFIVYWSWIWLFVSNIEYKPVIDFIWNDKLVNIFSFFFLSVLIIYLTLFSYDNIEVCIYGEPVSFYSRYHCLGIALTVNPLD